MFVWLGLIFLLVAVYSYVQADAASKQSTFFAVIDLPPGSIITEEDVEWKEGKISEAEKDLVITDKDVKKIIGKKVGPFGVRSDRPLLASDIVDKNDRLYELKLVGDITIPEHAKMVSIFLIYDERKHPGRAQKLLADNVPVKRIYNNQNVPIVPLAEGEKTNTQRVPKAVSVYVNEQQKNLILSEMKNGNFYFTTIP